MLFPTHMMSLKMDGSDSPLPNISQSQKLAYTARPSCKKNPEFYYPPPHSLVRNQILLHPIY